MKRIICLLLILCFAVSMTVSCSKTYTDCSIYANNRDVSDRDVKYVEISIKDYGKIVLLLDATTAPITVTNFISLVEEGFYDGLTLHRIIKDFMIQGGDPDGNGTGGSPNTIKGEFSENGVPNDISHLRGVVSMARNGYSMDSASSQFFICSADSTFLDGNYAAFGYVLDGMSVVDKIVDEVFPKTYLAEYYGTSYHQIWSQYGNGALENDEDKPVIEYIKVLESY